MPGALISGSRSYVATFWLGTSTPLLAGKRRLDAAVEEVSHVRVLLGFRRPQHASSRALTPLRPRCAPSSAAGRRRGRRSVWSYDVIVATASFGRRADVEPVEVRIGERAHDLPHAVGAVVEADHGVAVAHRRDRLAVLRRSPIGMMNSSVSSARRTRAGSTSSGSLAGGPTPSTTARYHFSVRSQRGRGPCRSSGRRRSRRSRDPRAHARAAAAGSRAPSAASCRVRRAGRGSRRAARSRAPRGRCSANRCLSMRVHAAVADQPTRCSVPPLLSTASHASDERRIREERCRPRSTSMMRTRSCITTRPGAEVEMADLAVSHLACGQTHRRPDASSSVRGAAAPERVPGRSARERDRVAFGLRAVSPAVEDDQRDGLARGGFAIISVM